MFTIIQGLREYFAVHEPTTTVFLPLEIVWDRAKQPTWFEHPWATIKAEHRTCSGSQHQTDRFGSIRYSFDTSWRSESGEKEYSQRRFKRELPPGIVKLGLKLGYAVLKACDLDLDIFVLILALVAWECCPFLSLLKLKTGKGISNCHYLTVPISSTKHHHHHLTSPSPAYPNLPDTIPMVVLARNNSTSRKIL